MDLKIMKRKTKELYLLHLIKDLLKFFKIKVYNFLKNLYNLNYTTFYIFKISKFSNMNLTLIKE